MSVSSVAFAFGDSIVVLDAARFLQGVGGACSWAGGMAWLATAAPQERRGEVIGTALGAAIFGVQLGPVLGALATAVSQEAAFSSIAVLGAGLAAWALATPAPAGAPQALTTPLAALRERSVRVGMWLTILPAMGFGVLDVLAPLRLDELGASGLAIGATFFVAAGCEAIISPLAGRIADRRGAAYLIRPSLLAAVVALVLLQLPGSADVAGGRGRARRRGARAAVGARRQRPQPRGRPHRPASRASPSRCSTWPGRWASRSARGRAAGWPRSPATRCPTSRSPRSSA